MSRVMRALMPGTRKLGAAARALKVVVFGGLPAFIPSPSMNEAFPDKLIRRTIFIPLFGVQERAY